MEPIRYGASQSLALSGIGMGNQSEVEIAMLQISANIDSVQRMIDALMPAVDDAVNELACTKNDNGRARA